MTDPQQPSGDTFHMTGDFRGAILNIKSTLTNVTQTIGALPDAEPSLKEELQQLIAQLQEALEGAPPDKAQEAEAVAKTAFSPHAWGWTSSTSQPRSKASVFPTRVGVDRYSAIT